MLLRLPFLISILALASAPLAAAPLAGVWNVGDTRNCTTGNAWVLLADGHYAEVKLPSGPINAVGLWKDETKALAYTHQHLPFEGLAGPGRLRRMTMVSRTPERMVMKAPSGKVRTFHRCPVSALKAPPGGHHH